MLLFFSQKTETNGAITARMGALALYARDKQLRWGEQRDAPIFRIGDDPLAQTPKLADECKKLLDNGFRIELYRNDLGTYTAMCSREDEEGNEIYDEITDDFEPSQALYRLTEKVFGNIVGASTSRRELLTEEDTEKFRQELDNLTESLADDGWLVIGTLLAFVAAVALLTFVVYLL